MNFKQLKEKINFDNAVDVWIVCNSQQYKNYKGWNCRYLDLIAEEDVKDDDKVADFKLMTPKIINAEVDLAKNALELYEHNDLILFVKIKR